MPRGGGLKMLFYEQFLMINLDDYADAWALLGFESGGYNDVADLQTIACCHVACNDLTVQRLCISLRCSLV